VPCCGYGCALWLYLGAGHALAGFRVLFASSLLRSSVSTLPLLSLRRFAMLSKAPCKAFSPIPYVMSVRPSAFILRPTPTSPLSLCAPPMCARFRLPQVLVAACNATGFGPNSAQVWYFVQGFKTQSMLCAGVQALGCSCMRLCVLRAAHQHAACCRFRVNR